MNKFDKLFLFLVITIVLNLSCSKDKKDNYQEVYEVELIGTWTKSSHPSDFPSSAHFSPMAALSHIDGIDLINEGLIPTDGVKELAETGKTDLIEKEFEKLHNQTYSLDQEIGKSINANGKDKIEIGVERGRHVVSVFSMIAPSPDWFIAARASLIDPSDGKWYDEVVVHAIAYDAGTDNGLSFISENLPTDSLEGVHRISTGPLTEGNDTVNRIAKFIFRRVKK